MSKISDKKSARSERLLELGNLASAVAHDLNNVLTGILGHISFLRMAREKAQLSNSSSNYKNEAESMLAIEEGAKRGAALTQQILDFARGERAAKRTENITEITRSALKLLEVSLPSNVTVSFHRSREPLYVVAEDGQLSQLVMNLLINARDALPNGGTVDVTLSSTNVGEVVPSSPNTIRPLPPGSYAKLTVADNGTGISAELQGKIFEPFFTTKGTKGTGLGLSTVHSILEMLGGSLSLVSEDGIGTSFEIYIPLAEQTEDAPTSSPTSPTPQTARGVERVLIVDDEESVRMVIERSLEHLGYTVTSYSSGKVLLSELAANLGNYQLAILDMIMPDMSGDEIAFALRKLMPNLPILIASGYSSDAKVREVMKLGNAAFIQKPFAIEDLAEQVRSLLGP